MKYLKTYENNIELLPDEYVDFIKWLTLRSDLKINSKERKFAYNEKTETWLDLKDYETYYTIDDLFSIYKSEKYNL